MTTKVAHPATRHCNLPGFGTPHRWPKPESGSGRAREPIAGWTIPDYLIARR